MKEDITKALIQKSTIRTSDDFTDRLLLKIKEEQTEHITNVPQLQLILYPLAALIVGGVVYIGAVLLDVLPQIHLFKIQIQINRTPYLISLSALLLFGANHLWRLHTLGTRPTKDG